MTLEDALVVWARTPHPLVANAIDALSEEALATFAAPKAKTRRAFHAAWLERAVDADAVTIGWLARTLREKLEVRESPEVLRDDFARVRHGAFFERLDALAPYASDPRVSSALCGVFEDMPFTVWDVPMTTEVYAPVVAMLIGSADARVVVRLRAVLAEPRVRDPVLLDVARALLPGIIESVARLPTPALVDEAVWREAAVRRRVAPDVHEAALLAQAVTHEAARGIYADVLIERGEARGEFIALQLDGSDKALKRANELLKKHSAEWLGPLHFALRRMVFERGFLVEAELSPGADATPEMWSAAARDAQLATVRRLRKGRGSTEHLYDFYGGGALRALRVLEVPGYDALQYLPALKGSVRELVLFERFSRDRVTDFAEFELDALTVSGPGEKLAQWVAALSRHGLLARLKRITCTPSYSRTSYFDSFCDPRLWSGSLQSFELDRRLRLKKTPQGFEFEFFTMYAEALQVLRYFKGEFSRVRCLSTPDMSIAEAQALEAAARGRGVNIEQIFSWPPA